MQQLRPLLLAIATIVLVADAILSAIGFVVVFEAIKNTYVL